MNTVMTLLVALVVIVLHVWLCHRSPKFWYLGGVLPLLWIGVLVVLFSRQNQFWGRLENNYFPDTYLFPVLDSGTSSSQEKRN